MNRKRRRKTICGGKHRSICLLLSAYMLLGALAVQAEEGTTMVETLSRLEGAAGLSGDAGRPALARIEALELRTFGAVQPGSLLSRLARLNAAAKPAMPELRPAQKVEGSDDENALVVAAARGDSVPQMAAVTPSFLRIGPPGQGTAHDDYLEQTLADSDGKVLRFDSMPIPLFINSFPDANFMEDARKGIDCWQQASGGAVRFLEVQDPLKARILVVWKRLGTTGGTTGCALGAHTITRFARSGEGKAEQFMVSGVPVPVDPSRRGAGYIVPPQQIEVNLDLLMSKPPDVRDRLLQNVVTHETGHALGLVGHSKNTNDMMYGLTDEHSRLSQRDINTLLKLYRMKPDIEL